MTSAATAGVPRSQGAPRSSDADDALRRRVAKIDWYHTIDLGHGVVTPGVFDHRPVLPHYGLPEHLNGLRVLDVATYDGFWAFEFERRGASEVVAMDLDIFDQLDLPPAARARMTATELSRPVGDGFRLASQVLGSSVRRQPLNVYDLSPEQLGQFDFVYSGSLLLHLACPVRALQRIRSVVKPGGYALIADCVHRHVPEGMIYYAGGVHRCVWWYFSFAALQRMVADAGFSRVETISRFELMDSAGEQGVRHAVFRAWP